MQQRCTYDIVIGDINGILGQQQDQDESYVVKYSKLGQKKTTSHAIKLPKKRETVCIEYLL